MTIRFNVPVAQLEEQFRPKEEVAGSTPARDAIN